MGASSTFYLPQQSLLAGLWKHQQRLDVDDNGLISSITEAVAQDFKPNIKPDIEPGIKPDLKDATIDGIVIPGMANLHSHAHQRAMAGFAERRGHTADSFWSWRQVMYQHLTRIEPEDLFNIAAYTYMEMLLAGYTEVAEFQYLHHDLDGQRYADPLEMSKQIMAAAQYVGIALTILPVCYQYSGFGSQAATVQQQRFVQSTDEFLTNYQDLQKAAIDYPRCTVGAALHSLRAVDQSAIAEISANCTGPLHIHIAEQPLEVTQCVDWSGQRPVAWLYDHAEVDERWCLIHATHLDDQEISLIANSGACVGLCPSTEANLGDGIFPSAEFINQGGRFGIGSDSHISISLTEELRWLEYAQRLTSHQRNVLSDEQQPHCGAKLFAMALAGGRQACMGPTKLHGSALAVAEHADLLVLDDQHPTLCEQRGDGILDAWLFASNQSLIRDVYVAGCRVISNGQHNHVQAITSNYRATLKKLRQHLEH